MARKVLALIGVVVVAQAVLSAACGGDEDSGAGKVPVATGLPGEVQSAIRDMVDRYNAKDVGGFLAFHTDQGLDSRYHVTREEATAILPGVIGRPPFSIFRFQQTDVAEDTAEVSLLGSAANVASQETFQLVKEAGAWKVDGYSRVSANPPAGRIILAVSMREFSFDFDATLTRDGNVSMKITNEGQQRHEVILDKVPQELDLEEAIKAAKPPEEAEPVSFLGIAEPGETKRLVFQDPLPPGRYVFWCFMPDANDPGGTPHALKGMHAEFTVSPASPVP